MFRRPKISQQEALAIAKDECLRNDWGELEGRIIVTLSEWRLNWQVTADAKKISIDKETGDVTDVLLL